MAPLISARCAPSSDGNGKTAWSPRSRSRILTLRHLSIRRKLRRAPASAECLDEHDARGDAPAENVDSSPRVRERRRLRDDDLEIADGASAVLVGDNSQR